MNTLSARSALSSRAALCLFSSLGLLMASSSDAMACAVCFSAKNEASRLAFIITTAGLTILPLLLIAWGVRWVIRHEREQDALEAKLALSTRPEDTAVLSTSEGKQLSI